MYYPNKMKKNMQFIEARKHEITVQEKKKQVEDWEKKRKYFMLFRWQFLNKIKEETFDEYLAQVRKVVYTANFIKRIKALQIYRTIAVSFKKVQLVNRQKLMAIFFAAVLKKKLK